MYLGANVLVPEGFDSIPEAHFPLVIFHDHFNADFEGFRTEPPDPNLKPDYSERFHLAGYNRIQQEEAYKFYQQWIAPEFPRILVVEIKHANPYYDDSYAVNSANLGPYGDAIETELIPADREAVSRHRAGLGAVCCTAARPAAGKRWRCRCFIPITTTARLWRALTRWIFARTRPSIFTRTRMRFTSRARTSRWHSRRCATIWGTRSSRIAGRQPVRTGARDRTHARASSSTSGRRCIRAGGRGRISAADLRQRDRRDRSRGRRLLARALRSETRSCSATGRRSGRSCRGKIHVYVGSADTYFLNDAVYYLEDFLKATTNPPYDGEVKYGDRAEHCWNGDPTLPNYLSRLHYNTMYLPKILDRMKETAPAGADLTSWRY